MRRLRRFAALSRLEKRILAQTFFWALVYAAAIRVFSFSQIRQSIQQLSVRATLAQRPPLATVSEMVRVGNRFSPGSCLSKAMAGRRVLASWGYESAIRIGVASPGTFQAHAWLECEGQAIGETGPVEARWAHLTDL